MSTLRQFLTAGGFESIYKQYQIAVYNSNYTSLQNGGTCCCFIVPAGVTSALFEVWSAGGDGAGACCCQGPLYGAGPGQYARRNISVTPGCWYTVCAAGSGCRSCCCCGVCGFPSWVRCVDGSTMVVCAQGGLTGCTYCFRSYQGCTGVCYPTCILCCGVYNSDLPFGISAFNNPTKESNYCWNKMWSWNTGAPVYAQNLRLSPDYCCTQLTRSGEDAFCTKWPGGSGMNTRACGSCCYGGFGTGGLVLITFG